MKFDFSAMTVVDQRAVDALKIWLSKQPRIYDQEKMTVFVDSEGDFCAIEYINRPFQYTSFRHTLLECVTSRYVPCMVTLRQFREHINSLDVSR